MGSLITGLVLIPWIGTKGAQQVFIVVSAASGVLAMLPLLPVVRRPARLGVAQPRHRCARGRRIVFRLAGVGGTGGTHRMGPLTVVAGSTQRAVLGRGHERVHRRH